MSNWRAGFVVGRISKTTQTRFLNLGIRENRAWAEIERIGKEYIKMFDEMDREFALSNWVYKINNMSSELVLERHKTDREIELAKVERKLMANEEMEVSE